MIEFACPHCGKKYRLRDDLAGRAAKCAQCKNTINIPAAPSAPESVEIPFADEEPAAASSALGQLAQAERSAPAAEPDRRMPGATGYPASVATPTAPPAPRRVAPRERQPSIMLSAVGAALGAGVGTAVWIGIGYATGYEIGYIAILVGILAGVGGVKIGGMQSPAVGAICAVMGLAGVLAGSYGTYYVMTQTPQGKQNLFKDFKKVASEFVDDNNQKPTDAEVRKLFDDFIAEMNYFDFVQSDFKSAALLGLFGLFGLSAGWKYGSGSHKDT